MAGSQSSFSWSADTLIKNVNNLPKVMNRAITAAVEFHATRGEVFMKSNAKWHDRTGNARAGLHTTTQHTSTTHTIILAHGVPYGIWLEVRWAARLAIILPAVTTTGRELMSTLNGLMAKM